VDTYLDAMILKLSGLLNSSSNDWSIKLSAAFGNVNSFEVKHDCVNHSLKQLKQKLIITKNSYIKYS